MQPRRTTPSERVESVRDVGPWSNVAARQQMGDRPGAPMTTAVTMPANAIFWSGVTCYGSLLCSFQPALT
jgi:hypothetical protein